VGPLRKIGEILQRQVTVDAGLLKLVVLDFEDDVECPRGLGVDVVEGRRSTSSSGSAGLVLEGPCATGEHAAKANQTQRECTEESADRSNASHRREDHEDREKDPDKPGCADVPGERRHEE